MRILHVLDHSLPVQSGYAFRSHSILLAQRRSGLAAMAVTSPKHHEGRGESDLMGEQIGGVQYYRSGKVSTSSLPLVSEIRLMLRLGRTLLRLIDGERPDVLHPHSPTLNAIPAILVGMLRRIPVVYEMRSSWEDAAADRGTYGASSWKYKLGRWLETWVCRKASCVTVICEGLKRELIVRGISPARITVVPNGVDVELFAGCRAVPTEAGMPLLAGRKVVGFMGSFFRWEGLELLVAAMAKLKAVRSDIALLLVGGGEMEAELRSQVRALGLEDVVLMPGQVTQDKIPALYAQVDVMAFPRHSTRLTEMVTPLKPLEAMAMGKAVVASDVGGHQELISDGQTGMLFKAGNVDALIVALTAVLDDSNLRRSLERQGATWVRAERAWDVTTRPYKIVYNDVLSS